MRLRRLLLALAVLVGGASAASAQAFSYETITVSNTAIGLSATTLSINNVQANACFFSVETADIRLRYDGTSPTASVGHAVESGSKFPMTGNGDLRRLRMIRAAGSDATVSVTCSTGTTQAIGTASSSASVSVGSISASGALTHDPDDASISGGQDNDNVNSLTMIHDGSVWRRLTFGTAGSASTQVITVQGIASMTPFLSAQSGTWTVQPGNTANTTAWLVTGTGGTFPATQSGTWNVATLTTLTGGGVASAAADSGNPVKVGGKYNSTPVTLTDGNRGDIQLDANGYLKVNVVTGGASGGTSQADNSAFTTGSTTANPIAGLYDATPDSVTDGRVAAVGITIKRALFTSPYDSAGTSMSDTTAHAAKVIPVASDGSAIVPDSQLTHDSPMTVGSVLGAAVFDNAKAGGPCTAVSADADAVLPCSSRQGERYVTPSYAGTAASTGAGATGNGVPRENDVASAATGAAPPAAASYMGGVTSGATGGFLTGVPICDSQGWLDMTTATTTEIAPLVSGRTIYICAIDAQGGGATTMTFKRGTGTNCGTGTTAISPGWELTAQTGFSKGNGIGVVLGPMGSGTAGAGTTSGNAVCVTNSAGQNLHVLIRYAVY